VVAAVMLAGWAVAAAGLHGDWTAGIPTAALAVGVAVVMTVVRGLPLAERDLLADGLGVVGGLLAVTAWFGVATRTPRWAQDAQGLWRAAGALTYPNATAAVLVTLALWTIARGEPRRPERPADATGIGRPLLSTLMLGAAAATLSRGGLLALGVGLIVLAGLADRRRWRAAIGPLAGAVVIFAGLVPSLPDGNQPQLLISSAALTGGLLIGRWQPAVRPPSRQTPEGTRRRGLRAVVAVALTAALVGLAGTSGGVGRAVSAIVDARLTTDSAHRGEAASVAVSQILSHPVIGVGPGHGQVRWHDPSGASHTMEYVHDEYLQVLLELGAVGGALLLVLFVACLRWARSGRPGGTRPSSGQPSSAAALAATAAFAAQSGVDFLWHVPALPLVVAAVFAFAGPDAAAGEVPRRPALGGEPGTARPTHRTPHRLEGKEGPGSAPTVTSRRS
jgi:O-Antigen ligase